jgi:hypothetical protein
MSRNTGGTTSKSGVADRGISSASAKHWPIFDFPSNQGGQLAGEAALASVSCPSRIKRRPDPVFFAWCLGSWRVSPFNSASAVIVPTARHTLERSDTVFVV